MKALVPTRRSSRLLRLVTTLALLLSATAAAFSQSPPRAGSRSFDARLPYNATLPREAATARQLDALERFRQRLPGLRAHYDEATGATRSLSHPTSFLTERGRSADPLTIAVNFARENSELLGLSPEDLSSYEITDVVTTSRTGSTRVYLRQRHAGRAVYNGQLQVNVNREGRIVSVHNEGMPEIAVAINVDEPVLSARQAIQSAARDLGVSPGRRLQLRRQLPGREQPTRFEDRTFSLEPIEARLMWLPVRRGQARLVWNFQVYTLDENHAYDFTVDAVTGKIWTRYDWVHTDQYRVYAIPAESPNHASPLPPDDGRQLVVDPAIPVASPLAWHDTGSTSYTTLRGNNVHAYEDRDANNVPPASQPSCGTGLNCDFSINLSQDPTNYTSAAVTNLFYWNNVVHDVQYLYGFDEAAGNFQVNNFGKGGLGGDDVRAEAQDGEGLNNANFLAPPDGSRPRMQMFLWNLTFPKRDGDLDAGIIVHEYGHGVSVRQVGGPSNSSCLSNLQQPGEGWSDWLALVYTARPGDAGPDPRGIGTYVLGEPTDGAGIRTQRYSTDPAINSHTYESINGMAVPHGVGEVWAQALWEVYWALVDQHGLDPDLYNVSAGAGNHRAMLYVNEGLKNTACSPTFTDARDGIIQAAVDNFGGQDVCLLWQAFADFGLGVDAVSGGPNSTSPTNGFEVPVECQCQPAPLPDAGPDQTVCAGESVTLGTPALPDHTYRWSPGGQTTAQITVSPSTTTTYTLTATTSCGSKQDAVTVLVDDGTGGLNDDFESGAAGWETTGLWHLAASSQCASPRVGYTSPVHAFYFGQDATCDYDTGGAVSGDLTSPPISGITGSSTLGFNYFRIVEAFSFGSYDRTEVYILDGGQATKVFSLDSRTSSSSVWTSSGALSLAAFEGKTIRVRFHFDSVDNFSNGFPGWLIDDVVVTGTSSCAASTPPTVHIDSPPDGTTWTEGSVVAFSGSATDAQDGDLTSSLSWSSSLEGPIGTGGAFSRALAVGTHGITASVTDSDGLAGSDSITVTVNPNTPPVVTITAPSDGDSFTQGDPITFSGTAVDDGDGNIEAGLGWTSSLDGPIGTGGTFTTSALSNGTHIVTAAVTDSGGLTGAASLSITVAAANTAPVVTIVLPSDGAAFIEGNSVAFSGSASDAEDGDLSAALDWVSSLDGPVDLGAAFTTSMLSVGTHTMTASVTDSGGQTASASITLTIEPQSGFPAPIDWNDTATEPYSTQDGTGSIGVEDGGLTFFMEGNRWRRTTTTYTVTANTILEFEFQSTAEGEIHGIGFDEDHDIANAKRVFQLYGTQLWLNAFQELNGQYVVPGSWQTYRIRVGDFYQGEGFHLALTNDNDGPSLDNTSRFRNVRVFEEVSGIDWNTTSLVSYGVNQDGAGTVSSEDGGKSLFIGGNRWLKTTETFTITPFTVLEFEFQSTYEAEIHGIGFDEDDDIANTERVFQLYGTQKWNAAFQHFSGAYTPGEFVSYRIPVGAYYNGSGFHLVLVSDKDGGPQTAPTSRYRNVRLVEHVPAVAPIDFNALTTVSYSNQDGVGTIAVEDGGLTFFMEGNRWRASSQTFVLTPNTMIAFEYQSTAEGEIQGIGFDENNSYNDKKRVFQIFGTQSWAGNYRLSPQYDPTAMGTFQTFVVPVGRFYNGPGFRLLLVNDKDVAPFNSVNRFRNVRIYELP